MRVIGVLDVLNGRAVHARGGARDAYRPVLQVEGRAMAPGDPMALAAHYLDRGVSDLYVADLDAIQGRAVNAALIARLSAAGVPVWVDAGTAEPKRAEIVTAAGAARVVVGLETLGDLSALRELRTVVAAGALVFSLDLRAGRPVTSAPQLARLSPEALAVAAVQAGADAIIVLDLARVGMQSGVDGGLLVRIRHVVPAVMLLVGGGVRDRSDLEALAEAGCDGVLIATALHDGRLGNTDVAAARQRGPSRAPGDPGNPPHASPTR